MAPDTFQVSFVSRFNGSGQIASVATLGRCTQAAGERSGALLAVLDEFTRARVRQAAADEIYVTDPVLMVVCVGSRAV